MVSLKPHNAMSNDDETVRHERPYPLEKLRFENQPLGAYGANCTVLWRGDGSALVVDPGADGDRLADWLASRRLKPTAVFLTHGHFDHISGVDALLARFPLPGTDVHASG